MLGPAPEETVRNIRLKSTGLANWETEWGNLFAGKAHFKVFTHQDWVAWVFEHGDRTQWGGWLEYVKERYGYEERGGA